MAKRSRRRRGLEPGVFQKNEGHLGVCEGIGKFKTAWQHDDEANEWVCRFCGARKYHVPPTPRKYAVGSTRFCHIRFKLETIYSMQKARELVGGCDMNFYVTRAVEAFNAAVHKAHADKQRAARGRG